MKNKYFPLFIVYFLIFFFLILFINLFFFTPTVDREYEKTLNDYEEKTSFNTAKVLNDDFLDIDKKIQENEDIKKRYYEILNEYKINVTKKELETLNKSVVNIIFSPKSLEVLLHRDSKISPIKLFLYSRSLTSKSLDFGITLFKIDEGVRGKYKDKTINLYGVLGLQKEELFAVFVHELGHYFDVDYFKKGSFSQDKSEEFYKISWQSTKVIKAGQKIEDFVSGYAMTNKYEDFAESFIYYILHNSSFLEKAKKSKILKQKYNFFSNNLFINEEFKNTNFAASDKIEDYYRDITKINYFLENLLNYLENGI